MSIEIIQWILICIIVVSCLIHVWDVSQYSLGKCEALHLERVTKLAGVQLFRAGLCPNTHQDTTYRLSSLATSHSCHNRTLYSSAHLGILACVKITPTHIKVIPRTEIMAHMALWCEIA